MGDHTKGPWWADGFFVHAGENGPIVAQMYGASDPEIRPCREANARLIAAAPELLEALLAVDFARTTDAEGDWKRATLLTDTAIAKATQPAKSQEGE